jgi:hypothetical protein
VGQREKLRVAAMQQTREILKSLGGIVDRLVMGLEGHSGFNHNLVYQEEAVQLWLKLSSTGTQ